MLLRFHLVEPSASIFDEEGLELPDIDAARDVALKAARDIMAADLKATGKIDLAHRIDVTDVSGTVLLSVPFADVVTIGRA